MYVADIGRAGERIFNAARNLYTDTQIAQPHTAAQIGLLDAQTRAANLQIEEKQRQAEWDRGYVDIDAGTARFAQTFGQEAANEHLSMLEHYGAIKTLSDGRRVAMRGDMRMVYQQPENAERLKAMATRGLDYKAQSDLLTAQQGYDKALAAFNQEDAKMKAAGGYPGVGNTEGVRKAQDNLMAAGEILRQAKKTVNDVAYARAATDPNAYKIETAKPTSKQGLTYTTIGQVAGEKPQLFEERGTSASEAATIGASLDKRVLTTAIPQVLSMLSQTTEWPSILEKYLGKGGIAGLKSEADMTFAQNNLISEMMKPGHENFYSAWTNATQRLRIALQNPSMDPNVAWKYIWAESEGEIKTAIEKDAKDKEFASGMAATGEGTLSGSDLVYGGNLPGGQFWSPTGLAGTVPPPAQSPGAAAAGSPPPAKSPFKTLR